MLWIRSNDPVNDALRYDAEREEALESLPTCDICGEHIQGEYVFEVGGKLICEDCMDDCKHLTEFYFG